ncbi:phospho-2-dehydro-3-deoxyheptonate aldolase [Aneurinibacillus migulanus]|uniref:class I fructose-bisphosphate aldolase n=1 Tax=Aneurinibacillus migulanus TaxID=47500 RepID=UPI0005BDCD2B|nr:phospho-2-dehydro-3-deoxyheptonate aldolase [Aneurinibacillus migulanus]KIV50886.1 phospho-2-dehydro-3-deoxyheptonate aldolase [Aneurinibacillus migulanus]KPD09626.1 phospho-2-dehydro-3-deoxyheptonate aldolase [Aneurinibacillus migulanus]
MSKVRRMSRIFANDGKSITLALDRYNFASDTDGIDRTIEILPELVESGLDTVLVTYGMAKTHEKQFQNVGLLIRADITSGIFDPSVPSTEGFVTVEDALRLGADGVISMTFPGAHNEVASHRIAWELARESDKWNMVFMCETLPYGYAVTTPESNKPEIIAASARVGTELGADIIKTRFSGEPGDAEIVKRAQRPVLALGGPKTDDQLQYFKFVRHCMDVGAKGVAVGRNIVQDPTPKRMVVALNHIVHNDGTAEEAFEIYQA